MKYQSRLEGKLTQAFTPEHLEILNESPGHGLPLSAEKHFRVVVVSVRFEGVSRVDRHRLVHDVLAEELREHVHALSVHAFTPQEWRERQGKTTASPACLGGGKHDQR